MKNPAPAGSLQRQLNWFDATMIVSGAIIGAGIFMNSAESARYLTSTGQLVLLWAVGGLIVTLTGFVFAELGAMYPRSGGEYVYLEEAFGPTVGFCYGWTMILVTQSGSIAAVSYTCVCFIGQFIPIAPAMITPVAVALIWLLSALNMLGLRTGKIVQNSITVLKLLGLVLIVVYGLFLISTTPRPLDPIIPGVWNPSSLSLWGLALIPILFSYGGLHNLNFIAGEVKRPARTIPIATFLGVGVVIVLYVLVNLVYGRSMSIEAMAGSTRIASDAMQVIAGDFGSKFISLAIIVSTLGINNVMIMSGSRVIHAISTEQRILPFASKISRLGSPYMAIILQSIWTTVLLLSNSYGQLLQFVIFGDSIFFIMITLALFRLRKTRPEQERPYRAFGYPYLQLLAIGIFFLLAANLLFHSIINSTVGIAIILSGIPVFLWSKRKRAIADRSHVDSDQLPVRDHT